MSDVAMPERTRATKLYLTAQDVADLLQVDVKTVRRWRDEGRTPPAIAIGGIVRWSADVIDAWLAEGQETAS